jgi:hypothetical protein
MFSNFFPAILAVDSWWASSLPLIFRIALWGVLAGVLAMGLYAIISNQKTIANLKKQARDLRGQMMDPSQEDYSVFLSLAKKNIKVSLKLLGVVLGPVFIAALPVIVLAAWIDSYHGYSRATTNKAIEMIIFPSDINIVSRPNDLIKKNGDKIFVSPSSNRSDPISFYVENQLVFKGNIFSKPDPFISKKKWWHYFFASDIGYLSQTSPIEEIHFAFPKNSIHKALPDWISGWEWTFFIAIFLVSLPIKIIFKIH